MIIAQDTDKLQSTYQVEDAMVKEEKAELKKLYGDVGIDNEGFLVAWA